MFDFDTFVRIPYREELGQLAQTYKDAMAFDVSDFAAWLRAGRDGSLLTIGAGGSLAVAAALACLHEDATGNLARFGTPMDLEYATLRLRAGRGLLVTAGGGHGDSVRGAKLLSRDADRWGVFCGRTGSPVARLLADTPAPVFGYDLLPEIHGWVSVSALLGQVVVAARAMTEAYPERFGRDDDALPASIAELFPTLGGPGRQVRTAPAGATVPEQVNWLAERLAPVLSREHTVLNFTPEATAVAVDIDSKYAEGALGFLQVAEVRNFVHGRYQTVLKSPEKTGILSVYGRRDADFVEATLAYLPDVVPHAEIVLPRSGPALQVASVLTAIAVVGAVGQVRDLEPGWGSRRTFGDRMYDMELPV
ncbi:hypothetical protein Drose_23595 [Dactylosporangium roseum]|uniref:SIS domain-containing protein n=1 Tax=Dactylosporangium roseum TaxID=47989 RepID=A0ABY5YYA8_9ACTN|nr:hypothetical protein [Dactylosporangium roseum]UWZ34222.1 hypothetical protein Drose_23595 [Dactylosporangium roseum]